MGPDVEPKVGRRLAMLSMDAMNQVVFDTLAARA